MAIESGLRQRIRLKLRRVFVPLGGRIVGQPASAMTGPGRTDLYVLVYGRYVGLEIKTDSGKATVEQLHNITLVRKAGCHAWIIRSPEQAVAAVWAAVRGEPVSGDFDFGDLFKDPVPEDDVAAATGGVQSLTGEIGAFLQEPDIQLAVERNGHVPSSDGVAIEPAEDYTLHTVVARLDRMTSTLLDLTLLIRESLMIHAPGATSAQVAELLEGVEPPTQGGSAAELLAGPDDTGEPPTSAEPPKPPRSRRKG